MRLVLIAVVSLVALTCVKSQGELFFQNAEFLTVMKCIKIEEI